MDSTETLWTPVSRRRKQLSHTSTPHSPTSTPPSTPHTPSFLNQSGSQHFRFRIFDVPEKYRTPKTMAGLLKQVTTTKVQDSILHLYLKGSDAHILSNSDISQALKTLAQAAGIQTTAVHMIPPSTSQRSPTYTCVVRGVDITTPVEDVEAAIQQMGLQHIRAWRIISRATNKYTRLVRVLTHDKNTVDRLMENGLRVHFALHGVEASQSPSQPCSPTPSSPPSPAPQQSTPPPPLRLPTPTPPPLTPPTPHVQQSLPPPAPSLQTPLAPPPQATSQQIDPAPSTSSSGRKKGKKNSNTAKPQTTPVQSTDASIKKTKKDQPEKPQPTTTPPPKSPTPTPTTPHTTTGLDYEQWETFIDKFETNMFAFITFVLHYILPEKTDLVDKVITKAAESIFGAILSVDTNRVLRLG